MDHSTRPSRWFLFETQNSELATEMSPASRAPCITGMVSQGSQSLTLGLAKTAAAQLDEFVRSPRLFWAKPLRGIVAAQLCRLAEASRE